jgi:antitoxin component of MazEF toxin-antitoxin module
MKKKNQKIAKVLLSTMIVVGAAASPVYAQTTTDTTTTTTTASNSVKLKFPDVKSTYWGARHISKLALEGIIEGYEDGNYRAENSVSQQEVIVMAIRMMGLEDEVKALKGTTVFPDYLKVDDFFNGYIAVALNKGLIKLDEEKLLPNTSKTKWGARNATREWVAKITIRAIGQQATADGLASAPTSFTDNSDIAYSNLGYINAAVSLKIVDGFEDGSFKPGGAVTRAQMATFLSRSQKNLASLPARVVKGYLNSLSSGSISIMDNNGDISNYTLSSDTVFYGNKNDEYIVPSSIQQSYEVSLIQVNGTAYFVEVLKDELQMDVQTGTLFKVNLNDLTLTYYSDEVKNYVQKELAADVTVTDNDGRGLSLDSLLKDSIIELKKSKISKSPKITQIVVKQVPINKKAEGTLQLISKSDNKLTMLEASTNSVESFAVSSQAIIASTDNTLINLDGLHVGDTISYEVVNSQIARITVKKQVDVGVTVAGTIKDINADKTVLTYTKSVGGTLSAAYLANNVQVQIEGLPNAGLFDLENGDQVTLEILNNQVTKITATNRAVTNNYFAKIISYDAPTKILSVQDSNGKAGAYTLSDKVTINYLGTTLPFSNFNSIFTSGKRIDLRVSNDKVISIALSTQIDGSISQLNVLTNDISIKTNSGQLLNFKLISSPAVEIPNKAISTLSDLIAGDTVSLTLGFDQTSISKIAVNKSFAYKIALTNTAAKKVTVVNEAGALVTYDLSGVPLVNQSQTAAAFTDLTKDEYVKLTFKGSVIANAELVTPIRGKITAMDTASSSITIQDFSGNNKVIGFGANYLLKQNGGNVLSFDALKVGDRVQIMKDASDKMQIQVASSAQRVFSSYDNLLNQLSVLPAASVDKNKFNLYAKVYVHKDTQSLTLGSLTASDLISIYVVDDQIVEIQKQ